MVEWSGTVTSDPLEEHGGVSGSSLLLSMYQAGQAPGT